MRCASWVTATGSVLTAGACSLTTSLSGLSTGELPESSNGNDASSSADARSEAASSSEAGTPPDDASSAPGYRDVVLASGPLAYYRLGDQAGTAKDEVGGHDGI